MGMSEVVMLDMKGHVVVCSVRPSTPFSADTDTPIFLYASRADVAPRD